MPSHGVRVCENNMNKISTGAKFHVLPVDEKRQKQWLVKCKINGSNDLNCTNVRVCSGPCTGGAGHDVKNELVGAPLQKKLKSDVLPVKNLSSRKDKTYHQLKEEKLDNTVKKQDTDTHKNLINRNLKAQGNHLSKEKPTSSQDIKSMKSPEQGPNTSASGCPMAMKGKMRYELVAADWKPVKTEPSVVMSPTSDTSSAHTNGNFVPLGSPKSPKPVQPIKKCRLSTEESEKSGDAENDDDIRALEEEIIELQEYNAKVESEMIKLRTDITQMEQHIRMTERDNQSLSQKSHRMSEYYESLRNNFISLLDQVRLPNFDERPTHDNFDTYLNRLQSLCAESCREENKAILSSVKQALQDFPIHLTSGWLRS